MLLLTTMLVLMSLPVILLLRQHRHLKSHVMEATTKRYMISKNWSHLAQTCLAWCLMLFWTVGGAAIFLFNALSHFSPLWQSTAFIAVIIMLSSFSNSIVDYYHTFHIEERFGFNHSTKQLFFIDLFKEIFLSLLVTVPLILLMVMVANYSGEYWWLSLWAIISVTMLAFNIIYQSFFIKWFNKLEPLQDGPLKQSLIQLAKKLNFNPERVFVIDSSKRSSHGNAYVAGLGKFKRIVLFDTLIQQLSPDEISAVLAHELGHSHLKHEFKQIGLASLFTGIVLFLFAHLIQLGWLNLPTALSPVIALILIWPALKLVIQPIFVAFSRRYEFQADQFSTLHTPSHDLAAALTHLSKHSKHSHKSDRFYALYYESHPMISQRLQRLEAK